jgi:putative membrane protein
MSMQALSVIFQLPWRQIETWCIAAWVVSMISLPIMRWTWGDAIISSVTTVSAIFQFAAVAVVLWRAWGSRRTSLTIAVIAVLTFGTEWLGSTTGFPFGDYDYTLNLQPQLFDVPLLIPLAWLMMLGPAWAVAQAVLGGRINTPQRRLAFIGLSALAMTAWDLYLDPQMVGWGFWVWADPNGYFGIPWSNYLGWLGVSALVTAIVHPPTVPVKPLLVVYGVVWLFQAIGLAVFWGQLGPAVCGFITMGGLLYVSLRGLPWRSH